MAEFLSEELIDQVVARQLREGAVVFASGDVANNHLDLGYSETHPSLRTTIVEALGDLLIAKNIHPTFMVPVPTGADGWVKSYNVLLDIPSKLIFLNKLGKRQFELKEDNGGLHKIKGISGIVIDDATSDGGTSEAAADYITKHGFHIEAVISLFFRGNLPITSKYQRHWLAHRPIPAKLNWQIFRQQGKIEQLTT